jgi:hypothetical protein
MQHKDLYLKALAEVEIMTAEELAEFALGEGADAYGIYEASPGPEHNT